MLIDPVKAKQAEADGRAIFAPRRGGGEGVIYAAKLVGFVAPTLRVLMAALEPVVFLTGLLTRLLGRPKKHGMSRGELRAVVGLERNFVVHPRRRTVRRRRLVEAPAGARAGGVLDRPDV
jgi:hypothetical protein